MTRANEHHLSFCIGCFIQSDWINSSLWWSARGMRRFPNHISLWWLLDLAFWILLWIPTQLFALIPTLLYSVWIHSLTVSTHIYIFWNFLCRFPRNIPRGSNAETGTLGRVRLVLPLFSLSVSMMTFTLLHDSEGGISIPPSLMWFPWRTDIPSVFSLNHPPRYLLTPYSFTTDDPNQIVH